MQNVVACLLWQCDTCWNLECAFYSPPNLERLNHEGILSLDTPENHIICRASALCAAIGNEVDFFFFFFGSYDTRCSCFFSILCADSHTVFMGSFVSVFLRDGVSQPGIRACGEGRWLSRRHTEHNVQYSYYQRVALLIV